MPIARFRHVAIPQFGRPQRNVLRKGGMRGIVERNEAVVQLHYIKVNVDRERFIEFVHDRVQQRGLDHGMNIRI